jgi:hypothetical protein
MALRLSVASSRVLAGVGLFALLAFGWVLLASGMNAYRQWEAALIVSRPAPPMRLFVSSTFSLSTPGQKSVTTVINGQSSTSVSTFVPGQGWVTTTNPAVGPGAGATPAPTPPAPPRNWGAVSGRMWANIGWWTSLSLLSAAGLAMLALLSYRARARAQGGAAPLVGGKRRLVVWSASVVFALYAGYHLTVFAQELL